MSNKAFRVIPPEPGEIFLMDRGGIKPDRMIICKRTKMSFGKEKTAYHLVDLENGEMLEIKTKTLDKMGKYVQKRRAYKDNFEMYYENYDFVIDAFHGLKQISKLSQKFSLPEKILIGKTSFSNYIAKIYVSRAGITLQYYYDGNCVSLDYIDGFPMTEDHMREFVTEKFHTFINSHPQTLWKLNLWKMKKVIFIHS